MNILVDGHCDTLEKCVDEELDFDSTMLNFNLKDVQKEKIIQMMALFIDPKYCDNRDGALKRAKEMINKFESQKNKFDQIIQINSKKELEEFPNDEQNVGIILTVENGSAICGKIENIDFFIQNGVKVMSIVWNEDNELGCGASTPNDTRINTFRKKIYRRIK